MCILWEKCILWQNAMNKNHFLDKMHFMIHKINFILVCKTSLQNAYTVHEMCTLWVKCIDMYFVHKSVFCCLLNKKYIHPYMHEMQNNCAHIQYWIKHFVHEIKCWLFNSAAKMQLSFVFLCTCIKVQLHFCLPQFFQSTKLDKTWHPIVNNTLALPVHVSESSVHGADLSYINPVFYWPKWSRIDLQG